MWLMERGQQNAFQAEHIEEPYQYFLKIQAATAWMGDRYVCAHPVRRRGQKQ